MSSPRVFSQSRCFSPSMDFVKFKPLEVIEVNDIV